jgi:hypothetical protein
VVGLLKFGGRTKETINQIINQNGIGIITYRSYAKKEVKTKCKIVGCDGFI